MTTSATDATSSTSSQPVSNSPIKDPSPTNASLTLTVEFSGGLEILFDNISLYRVTLPARIPSDKTSVQSAPTSTTDANEVHSEPSTVAYLVKWTLENLLKDSRRELFVVDGAVRPGILVLINDADWELEGEDKYELKDGDNILFVSTLHGG